MPPERSMYSSISLREMLLPHPELGQVEVSISPISVPRWVRRTNLVPHPGLTSSEKGNSPIRPMRPKRATMEEGGLRRS